MRNRTLAFVLGASLLVVPQATAGPMGVGVQGSLAEVADLGVGARLIFDLSEKRDGLAGVGSFDYFFSDSYLGNPWDSVSYWQVDGNVVYHLTRPSVFQPYVGAGLHYARWDWGGAYSAGDIGLNLVGGANFGSGQRRLFSEFRLGGGQIILTLGMRL